MFNRSFILKKAFELLIHILFWVLVLLFYTYFFGFGTDNTNYVFRFSLFLMPITMGLTYIFAYWLIPEFFIKKRFLRFTLYSVYAIIISSYLIILSIFYGLIYLSSFNLDQMPPLSKNILFVIVGIYLVVLLVSVFNLLILTNKAITEKSRLRSKFLKSQIKLKEQELNYLKMQLQPHFLFNSLNAIYALALKKKDDTPGTILRLSNLLDYLLYKTDKPFVHLNAEIDHLKDYIALESIRFSDKLKVNFKHEPIPVQAHIAPMLLLPLIENSFKHGGMMNGKLKIDISLKFENDGLTFQVENPLSNNKNDKIGLGLSNLKKRLQLIYPNKHMLEIRESDSCFKISLILFKVFTNG